MFEYKLKSQMPIVHVGNQGIVELNVSFESLQIFWFDADGATW